MRSGEILTGILAQLDSMEETRKKQWNQVREAIEAGEIPKTIPDDATILLAENVYRAVPDHAIAVFGIRVRECKFLPNDTMVLVKTSMLQL